MLVGCSLAGLDSGGGDASDANTGRQTDGFMDGRAASDARALVDALVDSPAPTFIPIRIACGEAKPVTDAEQNVWGADEYYSDGTPSLNSGQPVTGTDSPVLYDGQRYGPIGTSFSYKIPVPAGRYTVLLKFTENFAAAVGARVFDVSINGASVLSNFDIFAAGGDADWVAVDRTFTATVGSQGAITIDFTPIPLANNPKVDAILIEAASGADSGVAVSDASALGIRD